MLAQEVADLFSFSSNTSHYPFTILERSRILRYQGTCVRHQSLHLLARTSLPPLLLDFSLDRVCIASTILAYQHCTEHREQ
tara:strand:+ start:108 stop:350 length:243 start_codon:yes stop_codon:yes gene_type:complete